MSLPSFFRADRRFPAVDFLALARLFGIAAIHCVALLTLYLTEVDLLGWTLFLLTWGLLNFFWLAVLRRPGMAAALSLMMVQLLIVLSQFKFEILWMTVSFFDVLVIDADSIAFLLTIYPTLRTIFVVAALLAVPALVLLWRLDPFRMRRTTACLGGTACLAGLISLSSAVPEQPWELFQGVNHLSNFARSGVMSVSELATRGWIDSDAAVTKRLKSAASAGCQPVGKRPHIVLVLDEASFDITAVPNVKVPPNYARHFRSFDGASRSLLVEGAGGPTWYTEYNVLTGLSARSYGRFAFFVTRIAADRVVRGLPQALRRCGYRTFSLYPAYGAFLSARRFQNSAGVERLIDSKEMRAGAVEPDHFYYDRARELIQRERGSSPLFTFVYTVANHFPWNTAFRADLTPQWRQLGNEPEVDEYIRRQSMSAHDYAEFVDRLKREFPDESFLVIRFGDHQPSIAARIIDPALDDEAIARRIMNYDRRYFSTYYAIDAINFKPVDVSSARDTLDAAYLPIVVQEAAGLPLDASFAEQKTIMERCRGLFYSCAGGAEARRFNRLLIDAGLIKGLSPAIGPLWFSAAPPRP
jgi:hypothetical protein